MCCFVKFPRQLIDSMLLVGRINGDQSGGQQKSEEFDDVSARESNHFDDRNQAEVESSSECESPLSVMENKLKISSEREIVEEKKRQPIEPIETRRRASVSQHQLNDDALELEKQKESTPAPSVSRRKSISSKQQQASAEIDQSHNSIELAPEAAPRRKSSGAEEKAVLSNNSPNVDTYEQEKMEKLDRKPLERQAESLSKLELEAKSVKKREKPASLIRQSASASVVSPDDNQMALELDKNDHERQVVMVESSKQEDEQDFTVRKRQESLSSSLTADSLQSVNSQREFSDHSTQTTSEAHNQERDSSRRESRRRKSERRRSSSRRREKEEAKNVDKVEPVEVEIRWRASKSQPPAPDRHQKHEPEEQQQLSQQQQQQQYHHQDAQIVKSSQLSKALQQQQHESSTRRAISVSPSVTNAQVNIRHILENVAQVEGPFQDAHLAYKVAMDALDSPCWSTKVEGILALIRLSAYHQPLVIAHLHEIVNRLAAETKNLRSTVARSAIFALGDFCFNLKRSVEPELELIVQALLHKSIENTAFIRDDIRQSLSRVLDSVTQWRFALALMHHGANHKNAQVRRMSSHFLAQLVERMGAAKCLVGARDISAQLIPAAAKFAQDNSPQTRYYGRLILSRIMHHGAFERLLRKNVVPNLYRSTVGVIESIKRRGAGEPPTDP